MSGDEITAIGDSVMLASSGALKASLPGIEVFNLDVHLAEAELTHAF